MTDTPLCAQGLAEACAEAMYRRDRASQALGMIIEAVGPGTATLSMQVREDMLQGHGNCHGGLLFALADSAFAFACNSYDEATVAAGCSIDFLGPATLGDRITAHAVERSRRGRTGLYDITLTNQHDTTIAMFRGRSHRVRGPVRHTDSSGDSR